MAMTTTFDTARSDSPSTPGMPPAFGPTPPAGGGPHRRRWLTPLVGVGALVIGAAGGLGIGHVAWPNAPTFVAAGPTAATPAPGSSSAPNQITVPPGGPHTSTGQSGSQGQSGQSGSQGRSGLPNLQDPFGNGGGDGGNSQSLLPPFLIPLLPGLQGGSGSGQSQIPGTTPGTTPGTNPNATQQPGTITSAPGAPSNISAVAAKVDRGVVDIDDLFGYQQAAGAGTGIVLTSTGLVLTNNHVIDGATTIQATDQGNGKTYTATVVGYDPSHDVALLQLHGASGLTTATIGDSSTVTVGQPVIGIGNAEGVGGTPSAAGGKVTALHRSVTVGDDMYGTSEHLTGLIEVNSDILPGDSGGPLVTKTGAVIGIDTAAAAGQGQSASGDLGEAIPINTAMSVAKAIESGHGTAQIHVGATAALGLLMNGTTVGGVIPSGAAAAAGVQAGDTITSVGGHAVTTGAQLSAVMLGYHPGTKVSLAWTDGSTGTAHHAMVTLGTGPAA